MLDTNLTPADERRLWDVENDETDLDVPFGPPDDLRAGIIDDTHQLTDSEIDPHERYDAGLDAASGIDPPSTAGSERWLE